MLRIFLNCFSSRNDSDMRRWVMITSMNKRINSPIRKCPFPSYTPLDIIPNSSILCCDDYNTNSKFDKEFLKDPEDDNSAESIDK